MTYNEWLPYIQCSCGEIFQVVEESDSVYDPTTGGYVPGEVFDDVATGEVYWAHVREVHPEDVPN